jgi:HEPN domain-containing protein
MASEIEALNKIIEYWKNSSDQNYDTMINLKKSKDFSWALFLGHLLLEKLLKSSLR